MAATRANKKILVLAGDGIGPEVMRQVRRIVDWMAKRRSVTFDMTDGLVGGAALDAHGTPLTDETMADALAAQYIPEGYWNKIPLADLEAWVRAHVAAESAPLVDRGMETARFRLAEKDMLVRDADAYLRR